jgi:hypothetical protein
MHGLLLPVRSTLTTLSYQAKQKLASQVKVCGSGLLLERRRQTVLQGTTVRIRRFREIYHPQGVQSIAPTYRPCCRTHILQQMRLIHRVPFSSQEVESFRQLIFNNLTHGLKYVLESMEDMQLVVCPENREYIELIEGANDLRDGEIFPPDFYEPLKQLWNDRGVQQAWERGNEAALPEKYIFFPCFLSAMLT